MEKIYRTKSGDVWDQIAGNVYGDELYVSFLMENNQEYLEYFVFPEGVCLKIRELPKEKTVFPDWRR